jgi:hypothetical protein
MQNPRNCFQSAALTTAFIVAACSANGQILNGTTEPAPSDLAQRVAAAEAQFPTVLANALTPDSVATVLRINKNYPKQTAAGVTDFDNVVAPCDFSKTSPLLGPEQYAFFLAPPPNGGAILNECGTFGISAHSPPNFLAFNNTAPYTSGGIPETPELIVLDRPSTSSVSFWISCGLNVSTPVGVVAYGPNGVLGVMIVRLNDSWKQVTLTAPGIIAFSLVGNPPILLVDDILSQ